MSLQAANPPYQTVGKTLLVNVIDVFCPLTQLITKDLSEYR